MFFYAGDSHFMTHSVSMLVSLCRINSMSRIANAS